FGAVLFGGMDALQFRLQAAGSAVSGHLLLMLPYLATLAVLAAASTARALQRLRRPPAHRRPHAPEARRARAVRGGPERAPRPPSPRRRPRLFGRPDRTAFALWRRWPRLEAERPGRAARPLRGEKSTDTGSGHGTRGGLVESWRCAVHPAERLRGTTMD